MHFTQNGRLIEVTTPLGTDVLLLEAFSGREELSRPFHFTLDMLSTDEAIEPEDIVGKPVSFSIRLPEGGRRPFGGFVRRFVRGPNRIQRLRCYSAEVVPWLWFLTRTADCRIFQNKDVKEILEEVFEDLGFADYDLTTITGVHPKREYCVQYRESDFDFLSRLMEEEGIFYWFTHEAGGRHILHLADSSDGYGLCPVNRLAYSPGSKALEHVESWEHAFEFRTGAWAQNDFNFEKPGANLHTTEETVLTIDDFKTYERFDYPGHYADKGDGQQLTRVRMEAEEWPYDRVQAASRCRSLHVGHTFTLVRHEVAAEEGQDYVLLDAVHSATNGSYTAGGSTEDYRVTFAGMPASRVFRPARTTPKPRIAGLQTAIVVGKQGEKDVETDKYGRVHCQFFWDRRGRSNEKSSCFIRVAQSVAGKRWGAIFLPRIGHEVVVAFLEGDPDRPLIVGSVYNGWTMPPYALPAEKSKATIKTMSFDPGGGFNELRFEDKKGSEQIFIHAEKDLDIRIKNDRREYVGNDRHLIVGRDRIEQIDRDRHAVVKRDDVTRIDGDAHRQIGGNSAIKVSGSAFETVGGSVTLDYRADVSLVAAQSLYCTGLTTVIEASSGLTLKVGASFVTLNAGGVFLSGPMVMINSGGAALSGTAGAALTPAEPLETAEADTARAGERTEIFKQKSG